MTAVLRPLRERGTIVVTGPDRCSWLNGVVTADVGKLSTEAAVFGLALGRTGKILSDVVCLASADAVLVSVVAENSEELFQHWQRMLVMEDAEIHLANAEWQWFLALGIADTGPLRTLRGAAFSPLQLAGLGATCIALPASVDSAQLGLPQLADDEWLALRLEHNVPLYGVDFDGGDRPHEAGLERAAVSWTKGCYLGQEVVCMQEMRGKVKRRRALLESAVPISAELKTAVDVVDAAGNSVGQVTSLANHPTRPVGWVMARVEVESLEGELSLRSDGSVPGGALELPLRVVGA